MAATDRSQHSNTVLVVTRAGYRRFHWDTLIYAYKQVVKSRGKLIILGIIDRIPTHLGCKKATIGREFNGTNELALARLTSHVSNEFEFEFFRLAQLCEKNQILLEYIIVSGESLVGVLLQQAAKLKPRCIVLDRSLKNQKEHYAAHNLTCDMLLMKKDGRACKLVTNATTRSQRCSSKGERTKSLLARVAKKGFKSCFFLLQCIHGHQKS